MSEVDEIFEKILCLVPGFMHQTQDMPSTLISTRETLRQFADQQGMYYVYLIALVLSSNDKDPLIASCKKRYSKWREVYPGILPKSKPFTSRQLAFLDKPSARVAYTTLTGKQPTLTSNGKSSGSSAKKPADGQRHVLTPQERDSALIKGLSKQKERLAIVNAKVVQLDRRETMYQDHPIIHYLADLEGGYVKTDIKLNTTAYPIKKARAMLTDAAVQKNGIKKGDTLMIAGLPKISHDDGLVFTDVRTVRVETIVVKDIASNEQVELIAKHWWPHVSSLPKKRTYSNTPLDASISLTPGDLVSRARDAENIFELMSHRMRAKLEKARLMAAGKNLVFIKQDSQRIIAVIGSQSKPGKLEYASFLEDTGRYCCYSQDGQNCFGMAGNVCKHIILMIVAVNKERLLPIDQLKDWVAKAVTSRPKLDEDLATSIFIQYKMKDAHAVEWRTVEILPEDLQAF